MEVTTNTTTRYWVVPRDHALISMHETEDAARERANALMCSGIDVLRIERQVVSTTTTLIAEF